jgi:hypothetical protein
MRGGPFAVLLCVASLAALPASAGARGSRPPLASTVAAATAPQSAAAPRAPKALVVFLPPLAAAGESPSDALERELASIPQLSPAILSATQGTYKADQLLLDMTQGARVAYSSYSPTDPPSLASLTFVTAPSALVSSWPAALRRAQGAPQLLAPGLLASSIPGGAAYAAPYELNGSAKISGSAEIGTDIDIAKRATSPVTADWPLAANRAGKIAAVSFGSASTLLARIAKLRGTHSLVVADLPQGLPGYADLRALAASRPPGELLGVIQSAREGTEGELLWTAFAGLGAGGRTLTSQTTNQRGLIASIDLAPTILGHLGLPIPADMRGKPVELDGSFQGARMRALKQRLEVIAGRRLPAIAWLVVAWALLLATMRLPVGRRLHRPARGAWALRTGALAMLWTPVVVLVPAALEPSRTTEFVVIVASCFALATLTDSLVPWPRAPIVPAVAAILALSVDALAGTQLLMRSVLGPDPILGARFYGIGNELKSALAVLVFTAVAAALYPAVRSRRTAATMACAGIVLAIVEGSARIGAGVGGVILVSAGTAVATTILLPGRLNRRRILIVMAAPVLGLIALAALDLATAYGGGHFTGSVLDARSSGDIRDIVARRYGAAWDELKNHLMPVATALALVASAVAVLRRDRVCAPVDSDPAWLAALAGGLTAGVVGALTEDSGPVLLVVAVFMLASVLGYLWGGSPARVVNRSSPSTTPATRSRALRPSKAPSG